MNTIEQQRIKAGLTQAQLAERVGCSQTTITRLEKGNKGRPVLLKAIDDALAAALSKSQCATHTEDSAPSPGASPVPVDYQAMLAQATDALHDKITLQAEIIQSQRQTIEAQKQTIETMKRDMGRSDQAPPSAPVRSVRAGGKKQSA